MKTIYLSLVHTGSWGYLFHEIPCRWKSSPDRKVVDAPALPIMIWRPLQKWLLLQCWDQLMPGAYYRGGGVLLGLTPSPLRPRRRGWGMRDIPCSRGCFQPLPPPIHQVIQRPTINLLDKRWQSSRNNLQSQLCTNRDNHVLGSVFYKSKMKTFTNKETFGFKDRLI